MRRDDGVIEFNRHVAFPYRRYDPESPAPATAEPANEEPHYECCPAFYTLTKRSFVRVS